MAANSDLALRAATPADSAALTAIAQEAKAFWGYPPAWLAAWSAALTIEPDWLRANMAYVAAEREVAVGFVGVVAEAGGTWTLEHLWVRPGAMGQGVGRALLLRAQEIARAGGAVALELDADPFAESFYLRLGARRIGEVSAPVLGIPRALPRLRFDLV